MEEKLKPCKKCGEYPMLKRYRNEQERFWVCDCVLANFYKDLPKYYDTETAIKAWNERQDK